MKFTRSLKLDEREVNGIRDTEKVYKPTFLHVMKEDVTMVTPDGVEAQVWQPRATDDETIQPSDDDTGDLDIPWTEAVPISTGRAPTTSHRIQIQSRTT